MATTATDTFLSLDTFRAERDGCLAHLVVDEASRTALAIDPRLDQVDEILEALTVREVRLTHVLDTHTHADHLSGVRRLAQRTGPPCWRMRPRGSRGRPGGSQAARPSSSARRP